MKTEGCKMESIDLFVADKKVGTVSTLKFEMTRDISDRFEYCPQYLRTHKWYTLSNVFLSQKIDFSSDFKIIIGPHVYENLTLRSYSQSTYCSGDMLHMEEAIFWSEEIVSFPAIPTEFNHLHDDKSYDNWLEDLEGQEEENV